MQRQLPLNKIPLPLKSCLFVLIQGGCNVVGRVLSGRIVGFLRGAPCSYFRKVAPLSACMGPFITPPPQQRLNCRQKAPLSNILLLARTVLFSNLSLFILYPLLRSVHFCVRNCTFHAIPLLTNLHNLVLPFSVQPEDIGWPTGNGKKLSNSQACCLAQLQLQLSVFPFPVSNPMSAGCIPLYPLSTSPSRLLHIMHISLLPPLLSVCGSEVLQTDRHSVSVLWPLRIMISPQRRPRSVRHSGHRRRR